jgi:hypothetical protein
MNGDTKLSEALKANEEILEYIISLNPHDFERLRNPLMRKVMPVRITLRRIAAMTKRNEQELLDHINKLAGLPLEKVDPNRPEPVQDEKHMPEWMTNLDQDKIKWANVLEGDEQLADPMPPINKVVNQLSPGEVVGIMHKWQPQPLFDIWEMRGLDFWSKQVGPDEWHIFVHKPAS